MTGNPACPHDSKAEKIYPIGWGSIEVQYCLRCGVVLREWELDTFGCVARENSPEQFFFNEIEVNTVSNDGSLDHVRTRSGERG